MCWETRYLRRIWLFYPILQLCWDIDSASDAPILGQYCWFSRSLSPLASLGNRLCEPIGYARNAPVAIPRGLSSQERPARIGRFILLSYLYKQCKWHSHLHRNRDSHLLNSRCLLALGTQDSNSYELRCLPIPPYLNTSGLTTLSDICFLHTYLFIHPTYPIYLPR